MPRQSGRGGVSQPTVTREILLTFAVAQEAAALRRRLSARPGIQICLTGIGRQNVERVLRPALAEPRANLVITSGFAGGLNPKLAMGTVVFELDEEGGLKSALLEAGAVPGRFHCAERIAVTAGEKRALWESTRADAVEMESGIIRALCRERGIPSATVRVISDAANEDLPLDFNRLLTADFQMSYAKLAWALGRSPRKVAELLRFQRRIKDAAERLADVLARVIVSGAV